jgi:pyrimidine deaminase RibD-like protein
VKEQTDAAEENFTVNCFLTVDDPAIIPSKWSYRVYEKHGEIFGVIYCQQITYVE